MTAQVQKRNSPPKRIQTYAVNKLQRKVIKCQTEFPIGAKEGRVDILTDESIIECKLSINRKNAYEGIGQLNHYKIFVKEGKEFVMPTAHISSFNLKKIINIGIKICLAPTVSQFNKINRRVIVKFFRNRSNPYTAFLRLLRYSKSSEIFAIWQSHILIRTSLEWKTLYE